MSTIPTQRFHTGLFFVTIRLECALPQYIPLSLRLHYYALRQRCAHWPSEEQQVYLYTWRKRLFAQFDTELNLAKYGHNYFQDPSLAQILTNEIISAHGALFLLRAFTVLPNHAHLLIDTPDRLSEEPSIGELEQYDYPPLQECMRQIKNTAGRVLNKAIGRTGRLWQPENFEYWVRNEQERDNIIQYIAQDARSFGTDEGDAWPFSGGDWLDIPPMKLNQ